MFIRSPYNYDMFGASVKSGLACDPKDTFTVQSSKDECDINTIVKRFGLTGQLPEVLNIPQSGDFTGVVDFKTAADAIANAKSGFMELPPYLRARFRNDPQELMDFMADDKNREEAVKLGLVNKPVERTRDVVQAVDELAVKLSTPAKI